MDTRSSNRTPDSTASRPERRTSIVRPLLALAAGLAFLALMLAIPARISANAPADAPANAPADATPVSSAQVEQAGPELASAQASDEAGAAQTTAEQTSPSAPPAGIETQTSINGVVMLLQAGGPSNGSFEDNGGSLDDWNRAGSADHSEALEETNFTPNISPTDGQWFALLCTGPGPVNGTPQGNIDNDLNNTQEYDTSILRQTFTLSTRDVPATLIFDYSFLTSEGARALDPYDDIFLVSLNGDQLVTGSKPGGQSPFPDVTLSEPGATVTSAGDTNGCSFVQGRSRFAEYRTLITDPGTYTLEFLVADQGDNDIDSGLLVDNVRLIPEIDLAITKTADPNPAVPGEPLTYEVTVSNSGTGRARDVIVTDTLPLELGYITDTLPTYVTATLPSGCTFSAGSGPGGEDQLFCDLGDIVGGTSRSFEIEVAVDSDALVQTLPNNSALVNTAEVDSETPDRNLENNIFILETVLRDEADLLVTKMSKPDTSVQAGDIFTYTIFVDNLGPSYARNVVLTDTILSSGVLNLVQIDDDPNRTNDACVVNNNPDGRLLTCQLGEPLEPQGDAPGNGRWVLKVRVRADQGQDINNEVYAFSLDPDGPAGSQTATADPNLYNNRASDFINVVATADLNMIKIGVDPNDGDSTVVAGQTVSWTIIVRNDGPSTSENVKIVDRLPAGLVEASIEARDLRPGRAGQCNVGVPGDPNEPTICQLGNLLPGEVATVTIAADVDPSYVANQPNTGFADYLPNNAFLTSDTFDPDTRDDIVFTIDILIDGQADLGIAKIDRPDFVIAGEQLEYTLTISNAGPSTAEDAVLLDQLPAALTAIEVNVINEPDAVCSLRTTPANILDCGFGNILPGKTISLVVTSLVQPNTVPGPINNVVNVSSVTDDPGPNANQAQQTTQVETQADVEVSKTGVPVKVPAGEQVKYTVWVENNGPSDAQNVAVYDLLPDEVVYEIDTNSPLCTRPVNYNGLRAHLRPENEIPLPSITSSPTGLATFVLVTDTNTLRYAILVSDLSSDVTAAHIHTGTAGVNGPVAVTLFSGSPPPFNQTQPLVGSVQLSPAQATAFLTNPAGFYVNVHTAQNPAGEIRGQLETAVTTMTGVENVPLRCAIGTLPVGESHHFDIWALVDPATPPGTVITNVAIITSTTSLGDPAPWNDVGTARNYVEGESDLHIRKFGKPDGEVRANEILTYTVVVDNLGPSSADGVAVKDVLQSAGTYDLVDISSDRDVICIALPDSPPGITVTMPISGTPWPPNPVPPPPGVDPDTGIPTINERLELDCTLTGGLDVLDADGPPNTGRWLLTVRVRGLDSSQNINNVASVLSEQPDPNLDNNDAFVLHDIIDVADLSIVKTEVGEVQVDGAPGGTVTLQPNQVTAGRALTYTMTIVNNGPSTTENVVLQDRLPPGIVVTGFGATQGDCETGTPGEPLDKLTCGLGTMAPGDIITVTINADVSPSLPEGTILENDAFVYSDRFDDDNTNNYATNLTTVSAFADLAVTKTDNPDPVVAGEMIEYTITVTNTGPSDAINVVVTDVLPQAVEFQSIRDPFATGVACSLNPIDQHTLTCVLGDMPVGAVRTFAIVGVVSPSAPATLTNQVSVTSDTADPFLANNNDTEDTNVERQEQLFINKEDDPDPVLAGTEVRYTITFGNTGPSQATNVQVSDKLPLGMIFDRCESLDPNNKVTCAVEAGDGKTLPQIVSVQEIRVGNTVAFTNTGVLDVGDSFKFVLVADVDPGYILNGDGDTAVGEICRPFFLATGYPYYGHDRADITADLLDAGVPVSQAAAHDDECTRVEAEADLGIELTDTPDSAAASALGAGQAQVNSTAGVLQTDFLNGDPVTPGGSIVYTLTVRNDGPSDAAQTTAVVRLSPVGLILDPNLVNVTIVNNRGQVVEIRDDGRLTILVGNDRNNLGVRQAGRLNAGTPPVVIRIEVFAGQDAACGSSLTTTALVETRRNDAVWPPILGAAFAPTPTEDPDALDNTASEDTGIVCPAITIDKTVSLDGTCPGTNNVAIGFLGQPVTYCYEVTNTGDTYLDFVTVTDTIRTVSGPWVIFAATFRADLDGDPNLPLSPGASFIAQTTVDDTASFVDCNDRPDTVVVTAQPTNRGRTRLVSVPGVGDSDSAVVETPCKGVDWRLQLPALNTTECDTWIQIQNVGNRDTQAMLVLWGDSSYCPPQAFGPLKTECTGLLRPGSAWTLTNDALPAGVKSGIVYSLNATDVVSDRDGNEFIFGDLACLRLFSLIRQDHEGWLAFDRAYREQGIFYGPLGDGGQQLVLDFGAHQGEPLAVTVNRTCPDAGDPNVDSSAAYVGISTDREGIRDPRAGQFAYYTPLVYADFFGMNSIIHIQNSGEKCTSLELWFQQKGECIRPLVWNILSLAPGEAVQFDPNEVVGPQWQGSVWLRSSQRLGIVVDTLGDNHFGAYHGVPADVYVDGGAGDFSLGTQVNYAPLIYREHQGWETAIQVQNLSSVYNAKVKVTFLDNSGNIVKTIVDWICPRGSQSFFLPVIAGLPGNWIGSARIESQDWTSPGDPAIDSPRILSVVMLEKYTDPAKRSRQEAVLYNALQEMGSYDWQQGLPPGSKTEFGGSDVVSIPLVAKGFRGTTTEVAVQNLNPHPGSTDFVILVYDQNGLIDHVCEKLGQKQVEYIDLTDWGVIRPGFLGSLVISANYTDQKGGAALGAVGVERVGRVLSQPDIPGDESKAFEGFPLFNRFRIEASVNCPGQSGPCTYTLSGQVLDALDQRPVVGATVTATSGTHTRSGTTDANGRYSLAVPAGQGNTVITVEADDYQSASRTVLGADCGGTFQQGFSLQPRVTEVTVIGSVENKATGEPVAGATVQAVNCADNASTTTAVDGTYTLTLDFAATCSTWVIASAEGFNPSAHSVTIPNGDTAIIDFQIKQTPTSRVLLYYGNGGVGPTDEAGPETDYTTLRDFYTSLGFSVDYTDVWPTAPDWPSVYKLVVLLGPGHDSGDNVGADGFTTGQKAKLGEFLQAGGHLVVLSDHSAFTGQAVENDLLAGLPVDLAFNSNSWADGLGDQITPDCVTDGVGTIDADQWTDVTSPGNAAVPGALVLQNASADPGTNCPNCPIVMSDVPGPGNGRVTIVGDLNFADDASRLGTPPPFSWSANNEQLIFNFLACP